MVAPPAKPDAVAAPAVLSSGEAQDGPRLRTASAAFGPAPSTLQQQAENLAEGRPALERAAATGNRGAQLAVTPISLRSEAAPVPAPAAASRNPASGPKPAGAYQVQVGAYSSAAEAEKALVATLERAAGILSAAAPVTAPVQSGSRQLYRARFAGFDSAAAQTACQELRRRQIECFVAKAE